MIQINLLCPNLAPESWCKFHRVESVGVPCDHFNHFHSASVIIEGIKPIFEDLSNSNLLRKCLHGKSQNLEKSVNNIVKAFKKYFPYSTNNADMSL
ncbi:hypothetical protein WH47_03677 [Habropoda laboriosa]|uniref:Uncharacterized protein n=1 Tax=Habropoda laboriosa TaxID=597456 RepID=A0A0L7RIU2_9HYME|nr:hypothetical protein WH47_03677 [Habropoda laboriosa]